METIALSSPPAPDEPGAVRYNRIKIRLSIIDIVLSAVLLAVLAFSGIATLLLGYISSYTENEYFQFLLFLTIAGTASAIFTIPLDFYGGFMLEHRFGLSHQTLRSWCAERLKSLAVTIALGVPIALLFFFFLRTSGALWWLYFSVAIICVAVLLARIAPTLLFPLFYKFTPVSNDDIRSRIETLLAANNIDIRGIYSFNMSKDTRKANAGFTGIGKSRRILLSDTLLENFSPEEIEVIFAHEIGHYVKRHILKNIFLSSAVILLTFYLCGLLYAETVAHMGFSTLYQIDAIPVLLLYLSVFGFVCMPLTNAISRRYERQADRIAIEFTRGRDAFISGMEKIARLNLAEIQPHPLVEFLLYSHPSIAKRIDFARKIQP